MEDSLVPQQPTGTYLDACPSQVHFLGLLLAFSCLTDLQIAFHSGSGWYCYHLYSGDVLSVLPEGGTVLAAQSSDWLRVFSGQGHGFP